MMDHSTCGGEWFRRQRAHPRIPMEAFCTELYKGGMRHAIAVDLSAEGIRIQRALGGRRPRRLQVELEIPGVDEVVWALGEVRFDEVWQAPAAKDGGLRGIVRTSGLHIVSAAARHRRMLREYVMETWRDMHAAIDDAWLSHASCYRRG